MSHRQILEFSAQSDTGQVREHNEDAIIVCAEYGCVVLADGMGGYNAGEIASAMATQIVADYLCEKLDTLWLRHVGIRAKPLQRWMAEAISEANRQILESSLSNPECSGMGTTIVATCLFDHKILVAHVGDSRAYVFRQGKLVRLTHDHSVLQDQIDAGYISEEQARFSAVKNLITRAVGTQPDLEAELHLYPADERDLFLICSDGLTDMLNHDEIERIIITNHDDLHLCSAALIAEANAAGGADNISVVLFKAEPLPESSWVRRFFKR